jgi:hypothetical protein
MTFARSIMVIAALAFVASTAAGQFVKGNEAVKVMPDGTKKVETPPTTGALLTKPCPAANPACVGGGWKMVETYAGLMECTEVYARPGTCRGSTYGAEKRPRVWVVKTAGEWQHCTLPDLSRGCVSIKSLPTAALQ